MRVSAVSALGPLALLLLLSCSGSADAQSVAGRRAAASFLTNASVAGVVNGIRAGTFTCEDIIGEQLRRIDAYNAALKAFITVDRTTAMVLARAKDKTGGVAGPLHCVPVAVKDNVDLQGLPTTSGARALQNMTAAADSNVVTRIKATGGIIIGKTNMAEMSDSGINSESTLGGVCANPWDTRRSCLGSSGGSGAAVAAGLAVLGIGTDTEGSVIGPCAAAGLLCVRPTQGGAYDAMRQGVYPAFEKQDLVGIMARSRSDYLTAHDAIYGVDYTSSAGRVTQLANVTVRFLDNFYETFALGPNGTLVYSPDAEIVRLHNLAAQRMVALGASIDRYRINTTELVTRLEGVIGATMAKPACSQSCMKKSLDAYFLSYATIGPFRNARDLLNVIGGFPVSYQARLNATLAQTDAEVCGATACDPYTQARTQVTQLMVELLGNATVLAVPFSAKLPQLNGVVPGLPDQISPALNPYTGWPSLALPVGFSASAGAEQPQGLPVSLVLISTASQEPLLLGVANAYLASYQELRTPASTPALTVVGGAGPAAKASAGLVALAGLLLLMMPGRVTVS